MAIEIPQQELYSRELTSQDKVVNSALLGKNAV